MARPTRYWIKKTMFTTHDGEGKEIAPALATYQVIDARDGSEVVGIEERQQIVRMCLKEEIPW